MERRAIVASLAGLVAAATAIRFVPLGVQSFHHDEVITVMRVIPGSFGQMLHEVKASESNPPLYYVLAWGWARAFGRAEWGIRSLSTLVGTLTVPVGYAIGRQLSGRRVGLVLAALLAFDPMLTWYSQETAPMRSWSSPCATAGRRSCRPSQTGVSFLVGETGHVIAEPPRTHYAILPAVGVGGAALVLLLLGTRREKRGGSIGLGVGLGAVRARFAGVLVTVVICAYWLAFDVYVTQTPNLQRPDWRGVVSALGPARAPRAIVSWRLAGDPLRWYLDDGALRWYGGAERVREVDLVGKRSVAVHRANLPPEFHPAGVVRMDRLTIARYISSRPVLLRMPELDALKTGYGADTIVLDGPPAARLTLGANARTAPSHEVAVERAEAG
ncbi:MAG TPA: glycosyltransferase family 39 protein [Solirubrobacterales bacterium]|nr:glycosyltransferase family 39 protein [Solirubrobacterales bacterium]